MIGVIGAGASTTAPSLTGAGAAKVMVAEGDAFAQSRYATDAAAAEALCRASGAQIVMAPATMRFARALPGVAARLGGIADTHAVGFDGTSAQRWFYRQRIEGAFSRTQRPWIVLMESGCAEPYAGEPGSAPVEIVSVEPPSCRTEVIGFVSPESGQQTIRPDAEALFVAGAGWTKKQKDGQVRGAEAGELILSFVQKAKTSLGSSKSLVDLSTEGEAVLPFLTHLHQVGQTGSTPRHRKGLATCCHGEEPHVVGWRFINERRAVNLDANCGWARGKADVLYVADAFEVMREVVKLLE
jgi:electron transfer flavoprotein alpha subunit